MKERSVTCNCRLYFVALALFCAIGMSGCKDVIKPIAFPFDHGPHFNVKTEWWYFSGDLKTADGKEFGYEMTIFKIKQLGLNIFINHLAVSDLQKNEHIFSETTPINTPLLGNREGKTEINAVAQSFVFDNETGFHIEGSQDNISLDLQLKPVLPVVLEVDDGIENMPDGHISYYYSFMNLASSGTLTVKGVTYDIVSNDTVKSRTWMDHQWGNFQIDPKHEKAWDWFSFRLEDGGGLMANRPRDLKTNIPYDNDTVNGLVMRPAWVYQRADGSVVRGKGLTITSGRSWKDPYSTATYPLDWEITIPGLSAVIQDKPIFDGQSLHDLATPPYYEGIGKFTGVIDGDNVTGISYTEMTAYDTHE